MFLWDAIVDGALDTVKLVPFLFLTYLLMEYIEHRTSDQTRAMIRRADKTGPLFGGLLGVVPQCGFSAAAASLYAGRVITVGTLIAVLPLMILYFVLQKQFVESVDKAGITGE